MSAEGADPRDRSKFERRRRESKGLRALKGPHLRISSVPCIRAFGARILWSLGRIFGSILSGPLDTSGPLDLKICAKGPSTSPRDRAKSERRRYRSKEPELNSTILSVVKFADIRLVGKIVANKNMFFFKTCLENIFKKMFDFLKYSLKKTFFQFCKNIQK